MLPVINKIIEKFFADKITAFLENNGLLNKSQFGFRSKLGTNDILKETNDLISNALSKGNFVGAILVDLQKAFDTVNHEILFKNVVIWELDVKF